MMELVKINFFKKYCFSKKNRLKYLKKRWLKSVILQLKVRNLINAWTGKIKINKEHIFEALDYKDLGK